MPCAILRPQPLGHTTDHRVYSGCFCSVRGISARPHQAACDLFSADGLPACALCTSVIYRVLIFGSSSSHFPSLSASNLSMLLGPEDLSTLRPILTFLHASGCVCPDYPGTNLCPLFPGDSVASQGLRSEHCRPSPHSQQSKIPTLTWCSSVCVHIRICTYTEHPSSRLQIPTRITCPALFPFI